jgi:hypothetical protein
MKHIIVGRHPAAVAWIRENVPAFADASVIAEATADDVRGAAVAGNLPAHLAALAAEYRALEFAGAPPRGAEYDALEMAAAGARLTRYTVIAPGDDRDNVLHELYCGGADAVAAADIGPLDRLPQPMQAAVERLRAALPQFEAVFDTVPAPTP